MPSRPKPSLLEATSAISLELGSRDRFITKISHDWCTQHSVLGGYLNALMLSVARKYLDLEFGDGRYPDPVHVFIQFLLMVPPGPVSISCKVLRKSSRQCVVQVELARNKAQSDPASLVQTTVSIVTFADMSKEKGLTQAPKQPFTISSIPDREEECVTIDDPVVDATPVTSKLHWVAPRSAEGLWGHRLGGHNREVWLSFRDGTKISDLLHLALLSDMPLQPPATHQQGFYLRYALSTLCMSVEFKKRPDPATQWVLVRSHSNKVSDGRYDVNIQILDENGDILCLSNHVLYVSSLHRPPRKAAAKI